MLFALPAIPLLGGLLLVVAETSLRRLGERPLRLWAGAAALFVVLLSSFVACWAFAIHGGLAGGGLEEAGAGASSLLTSRASWGGGLSLSLAVTPLVRAALLVVFAVAAPVLLWAATHEKPRALPRLLGSLLAFVGAMQLLVLAADLLVLLVAWELVGAISLLLIAHEHDDDAKVASASYAFNATRLGGLGLFVAAGAAWAAEGTFAFQALGAAMQSSWGGLCAGGILLAAASKSAQLPFSPWLMRAMAGPSSASALLHSSTMVAAGVWLLVRLHEPLAAVSWVGPVAVGVGLSTAVVGGVSACFQDHPKRLLAASTSAQYGLMFAAVGAGAAGAAMFHLVAHAFVKALLFLLAGAAMTAAGSAALGKMKLGRQLPFAAAASAVGALSLAAVPPLGAAWTKEKIVAATGHLSPLMALIAIAASGLGAFYALRFHLLAFGKGREKRSEPSQVGVPGAERGAYLLLALSCLGLSALWLPAVRQAAATWLGVELPEGAPWELLTSWGVMAIGLAGAWWSVRSGKLLGEARGARRVLAEWSGLPEMIRAIAIEPALALAEICARFDARVVDAGVRGAAWLGKAISQSTRHLLERGLDGLVDASATWALWTGAASQRLDDEGVDAGVDGVGRGVGWGGRAARRTQTGALPVYYAIAVGGLLAAVLWLSLERWF